MPADPSRAVFLSYASQDAAAALRLCEALRARGVEVWFDRSELRGGDAWDQRIRRQIKDCTLFLPIVSANTQARREGYFRLEWKLADDRTHLMAKGTPFLVPVCVDDTTDWDALVPDSFMSVQWTRLPGGETPASFCDRVLALLRGEVAPARSHGATPAPPAPAPPARKPPRWALALGAVAVLGAGVFLALRPKPPAAPVAAAPATPPRDPELRRAEQLLDSTEAIFADITLAEEFCRNVQAQRPTDPGAAVMMARVQTYVLLRGFDRSEARYSQARQAAERALALAPEDPEALAAMGTYLYARGIELPRAAKLFRAAIAARPDEPRFYRMLDNVLSNDPAVPEAEILASAQRTAERFPNDALAHYELARHCRDAGLLEPTERALDRAIQLGPVANAIIAKARLALTVRGDPAEMKALLDRLPERYRTTDRAVFSQVAYAFASGRYDAGLEALRAVPEPWLVDFEYTGPKALLEGELLLLQGKPALARLSFEAAVKEIPNHPPVSNVGFRSLWLDVWLLARLGRGDEARARNAVIFPEYPRPFRIYLGQNWWFNPIALNLVIGERAKALDLMREAVGFQNGRGILRVALKVDPRMAPFRDDPEIGALLAEPERGPVAAGPAPGIDPKSVAVLAFANLSDDKGNEYFSDGISEELLTVLQRIPGLHVAARTSAFSFKGKNATAQEIGDKLGVAHLVEGSVQKAGNRVKISARLSRAATGEQLWSDSYTRDLQDVFAVQSEIAQTIVAQLRGQLTGEAAAAAKAEIQAQVQAAEMGGTTNVDAHQLYLQARFFANQFTADNLHRAEDLLQRAVALDPRFAQAWAALARTAAVDAGYADTRREVDAASALAHQAADRVLALEPNLAAAQLARFDVQLYDFDWRGAAESLRRASALAPGDAAVVASAANLAYYFDRTEQAIALARQAVALDPVNPAVRVTYASALSGAQRYDDSSAEYRRIVELSPTAPWGHAGVSQNLTAQGRFDEAAAEAALEVPEWSRLFALALAQWGQGKKAAADATLARFITADADIAAYQIAEIYAFRGESDRAFEWLERAYRQRDPGLAWSKPDGLLAPLHADARWARFMRQLGLADDQLP